MVSPSAALSGSLWVHSSLENKADRCLNGNLLTSDCKSLVQGLWGKERLVLVLSSYIDLQIWTQEQVKTSYMNSWIPGRTRGMHLNIYFSRVHVLQQCLNICLYAGKVATSPVITGLEIQLRNCLPAAVGNQPKMVTHSTEDVEMQLKNNRKCMWSKLWSCSVVLARIILLSQTSITTATSWV